MKIRSGEKLLKIYRHHPTPFFFHLLKVCICAFPFFFLSWMFQNSLSSFHFFILMFSVFALFSFVVIYVSLIYWLDKLIITDQRIVHVDWKYLTMKDEAEAALKDIQDVQTEEHGFLSALKLFDYGMLRLDTSSSYITMEFRNAPNPEGIRKFIFHIREQ